ncbi:hypothetical protein Pcinc_006041 [Petrolisthes cinctipes]|uniref:Uncharacterized protein n=1 Tax=Petrolisthes cinctipes TaxID=88211 RepID=A0AAE1KZ94_PETCI|nr:hypothetical protein Pcinc_006254 [Petrolisthes cinctipes]KAK3889992.1 hypothetical protein Pcinc_006041 [Petrolisthes cinctipes]
MAKRADSAEKLVNDIRSDDSDESSKSSEGIESGPGPSGAKKKRKKYKPYNQVFRNEWLANSEMKSWLARDQKGQNAYCKFCNYSMKPKLSVLQAHMRSTKGTGRLNKRK